MIGFIADDVEFDDQRLEADLYDNQVQIRIAEPEDCVAATISLAEAEHLRNWLNEVLRTTEIEAIQALLNNTPRKA